MKKYCLRTRFAKDIVAEIQFPEKQTGNILILLGGAPSIPSKPEIMNFWAQKGYVCIFPRLRGTWESGGEFLKNDPTIDIFDIINEITNKNFKGITSLKNPGIETLHKIKVKNIYILGASFGGTGALLASSHPKVKKVVALAPCIDWSVDTVEEPFEYFEKFTEAAFGDAYRCKKSSWKKLQQNKIFSPVAVSSSLPGDKILVLHAVDDTCVPIDPLYSFVRDTNCDFVEYKKGGHLGLNDTRKKKFETLILTHFK